MTRLSNQPSLVDDRDTARIGRGRQPRGGDEGKKTTRYARAKVAVAIVLFLVAGVLVYRNATRGQVTPDSRTRVAIDAQSGGVYRIKLVEGERYPWKNPDTGESTLYPAEACYWTRDGKAKLEPTWVFVKAYQDGVRERTMCPDCGREVVRHNKAPPAPLMDEAVEAGR